VIGHGQSAVDDQLTAVVSGYETTSELCVGKKRLPGPVGSAPKGQKAER